MTIRQIIIATIITGGHLFAFVFLLGSRIGPGNVAPQSLSEFILTIPLVWAVNYLPGPDLFNVAVLLNAMLWGYLLSMVIEWFVLSFRRRYTTQRIKAKGM